MCRPKNANTIKFCKMCDNWKPIKNFVRSAKCSKCLYQYRKQKILIYAKNRYIEKREELIEKSKTWVKNNREKKNESNRKWRKENREKYLASKKKEKIKNIHKYRANSSFRKKHIKNATPKWLTDDQKNEIKFFYKKARDLEIAFNLKYHVDHIIPIRNEKVCGLHVPWNLQILESIENIRKNNKF